MEFDLQPPVFGAAGKNSSYVNLDEIFADCFLEFGDVGAGGDPVGFSMDGDYGAVEDVDMSELSALVKQEIAQVPVFGGQHQQQPQQQTVVARHSEIEAEERKRKASTSAPYMYSFSSGIGKSGKDLSEQQKIERRERNREHAKRSRVRKKFMLECLQEQLLALRKENMNLRQAVQEHMPDVATDIFTKVVSERALVLSGDTGSTPQQQAQTSRKPNCLLVEPDFQLISALMDSQQNFAVSDPSLPDNPIVYASQGFLNLTGYTIDKVIGRNCRFLQGPGTDPRAVDIIRRGVSEGRDTSVCLLNYKADGSPFWNNFFISALRDQNGVVVNFVGVQAEVKQAPPEDFKEKLRKIPLPDDMLNDDDS